MLSAAAVPIAVAAITPIAALAAPPADADLIALGEQYEPLLRQYLDARVLWAPLLTDAHRRADREFGIAEGGKVPDNVRDQRDAALHRLCDENGQSETADRMHALYELMEPIGDAILDADVKTLAGLRAKALVFLMEVRPSRSCERELTFDNEVERSLFYAVADLTGITTIADEFEAKLAAALNALSGKGGDA